MWYAGQIKVFSVLLISSIQLQAVATADNIWPIIAPKYALFDVLGT